MFSSNLEKLNQTWACSYWHCINRSQIQHMKSEDWGREKNDSHWSKLRWSSKTGIWKLFLNDLCNNIRISNPFPIIPFEHRNLPFRIDLQEPITPFPNKKYSNFNKTQPIKITKNSFFLGKNLKVIHQSGFLSRLTNFNS